MRKRYVLYKRGRVYYLEDTEIHRRTSLQTHDREEAKRLLQAKNDALHPSALHLALGRTYLAASDPKLVQRTWRLVMEQFCARGQESTRQRRQRGMRSAPFDLIRDKRLIETTADDFRAVLAAGGVFTQCDLKCLHNLALGLGWLPAPLIPPKLWPQPLTKPKRAITSEEHQQIVQAERNEERRRYYELLWEIGAGQTDAASLTAENVDWPNRALIYQRRKTGEIACLAIGLRLEALLRQMPPEGPFFPMISQTTDAARAAEFRRRCRLLAIHGVSLHSYRYAWAQRAKAAGYPQRWAQNALGHNSRAVHQAYAKEGLGVCPSLEEYEQSVGPRIIALPFQKTNANARAQMPADCARTPQTR